MSDALFAMWFSRIIRWVLAAGFAFIAFEYDDLQFLYFFAAIAFVTGFLVPKRCLDDTCNIN